jgi:hypothetical protein
MIKRHVRIMIGAALAAVLAGTTLTAGPAAAAAESRTTITATGHTITKTPLAQAAATAADEPVCVLTVDGVNWGGLILCNYPTPGHMFSNGTFQVFAVGTDYAVWTRWESAYYTLSGWVSLGGQVRRGNPARPTTDFAYTRPTVLGSQGTPEIYVWGNTTGSFVSFFRVRSASGIWTPWARGNG